MINRKKLLINLFAIPIIIPANPVPGGGAPLSVLGLQNIVLAIGTFFIIVGPILLVISLILSAIWYMKAGADSAALAKAKSWLGYTIIGGLIMFGVGVIINTIIAIVDRSFFNGGSFFGIF